MGGVRGTPTPLYFIHIVRVTDRALNERFLAGFRGTGWSRKLREAYRKLFHLCSYV